MANKQTETGVHIEQPRQAVHVIPSAGPITTGPRPTFGNTGELVAQPKVTGPPFEHSLTPQPEQPRR